MTNSGQFGDAGVALYHCAGVAAVPSVDGSLRLKLMVALSISSPLSVVGIGLTGGGRTPC
jgi:hypothetical protein